MVPMVTDYAYQALSPITAAWSAGRHYCDGSREEGQEQEPRETLVVSVGKKKRVPSWAAVLCDAFWHKSAKHYSDA